MMDSPFGRGYYLVREFFMNILSGLFILAAGDNGPNLEWIVPVILVVVWIISGIGKLIASARQDRIQREKQMGRSGMDESKMRYKPIQDSSAPQGRARAVPQIVPVERVRETVPSAGRIKPEPKHGAIASLKKAMHDAMEEAKSQAGKPAVRRTKKVQRATARKVPSKPKPVAKEPVREVEVMPQEGSVLRELLERENIRKAIIYSEILGKPLAMRES